MGLDDFMVRTSCLIDETVPAVIGGGRQRQRSPAPFSPIVRPFSPNAQARYPTFYRDSPPDQIPVVYRRAIRFLVQARNSSQLLAVIEGRNLHS